MKPILLRADAGRRLGAGHVLRCLALGQAWRAEGGEVLICGMLGDALQARIAAAGLEYVPLFQTYPDPEDLQHTLRLARTREAGVVVIDGYHFDGAYQRAFRDLHGVVTMVIDDNGHLPWYHADILLNQNLHAESLSYRCDGDTKFLLGPRHALLRPEFGGWQKWTRSIPDVAKKFLVTLGGSDPTNVAARVIESIWRSDLRDIHVKVVAGPANSNLEYLSAIAADCQDMFEVISAASDMPELLSWADIGILGGGTTTWEAACLGLPFVIIVVAENQVRNAEMLESRGLAINMGPDERLNWACLGAVVEQLGRDSTRRHQMCQRGRATVTGCGAKGVADQICLLRQQKGYA